jgi:hypothetical protein
MRSLRALAGHARGTTSPKTRAGAASASPSSALDSCLFGTWTGTTVDVINHINNEPAEFTGPGPTETYRPDGTFTEVYASELTATINGVQWTETVDGRGSGHYQTENGEELDSGVSVHGTMTLLESGSYNNSSQFSLLPGPERYECSGDSLRQYPPNGSIELTRSTPQATPGS